MDKLVQLPLRPLSWPKNHNYTNKTFSWTVKWTCTINTYPIPSFLIHICHHIERYPMYEIGRENLAGSQFGDIILHKIVVVSCQQLPKKKKKNSY